MLLLYSQTADLATESRVLAPGATRRLIQHTAGSDRKHSCGSRHDLSVVSILEAKPIFGYLCVGKGDPPPSQERTGQKFGSPLLNLN